MIEYVYVVDSNAFGVVGIYRSYAKAKKIAKKQEQNAGMAGYMNTGCAVKKTKLE